MGRTSSTAKIIYQGKNAGKATPYVLQGCACFLEFLFWSNEKPVTLFSERRNEQKTDECFRADSVFYRQPAPQSFFISATTIICGAGKNLCEKKL